MCSAQILFAGDSDIGQIFKIFDLLGTPGSSKSGAWAAAEELPHYNAAFPNMRPKDLRVQPMTEELCKSPAGTCRDDAACFSSLG